MHFLASYALHYVVAVMLSSSVVCCCNCLDIPCLSSNAQLQSIMEHQLLHCSMQADCHDMMHALWFACPGSGCVANTCVSYYNCFDRGFTRPCAMLILCMSLAGSTQECHYTILLRVTACLLSTHNGPAAVFPGGPCCQCLLSAAYPFATEYCKIWSEVHGMLAVSASRAHRGGMRVSPHLTACHTNLAYAAKPAQCFSHANHCSAVTDAQLPACQQSHSSTHQFDQLVCLSNGE